MFGLRLLYLGFLLPGIFAFAQQQHSVLNELENHVLPEGRPPTGNVDYADHYARGHLFDSNGPYAVALDTQANNTVSYVHVRVAVVPEVPVKRSDVIVLATVTGQGAFFSPDRTNIYVESTVRANRVIKGAVTPSSSLVVVTAGGSIRMEDGRVITQWVIPTGETLLANEEFLLFLQSDAASRSFRVVRAWLLKGDHVFPADSASITGLRTSGRLAFLPLGREAFIQKVREAVRGSNDGHGQARSEP